MVFSRDLPGGQVPQGASRIRMKPAQGVHNKREEADPLCMIPTTVLGVLGAGAVLEGSRLELALSIMRVGAADVEHGVVAEDATLAVDNHISQQPAVALVLAVAVRGDVAVGCLQAGRLELSQNPVAKLVMKDLAKAMQSRCACRLMMAQGIEEVITSPARADVSPGRQDIRQGREREVEACRDEGLPEGVGTTRMRRIEGKRVKGGGV